MREEGTSWVGGTLRWVRFELPAVCRVLGLITPRTKSLIKFFFF